MRWIMKRNDHRADVVFRARMRELRGRNDALPAESWVTPEEYNRPWRSKPEKLVRKSHRRPNRRRRAQKLRAARQRKSWYQILTHEDEHG
jgi:hypothetical protein